MIAAFARAVLAQPRLWSLTAFVASGALLAGAWAFQLWGGLAPCELCLWQRWPHYAVLVLSIIILPLGPGISGRLLGQIVMIFAFDWFASAGIAGFHVGVEQHWWEGLEACGAGGVDAGANFDDLKAAILAAPLVRCDEVPWSLFGISLAGYNFLASAALGLFAFAVGTKLARTERSPA